MASLELEGVEKAIGLEDRAETTLGRIDAASRSYPDIDFTPYNGMEAGVSRRHAKLTRLGEGRFFIMDLSSTNSTYVNGEKLEPFEPRVLAEGDEIHLGSLKMVFHL